MYRKTRTQGLMEESLPEKGSPTTYHRSGFGYFELEKTELEVTVFDAELGDRAFHVKATLRGDTKERHTRSEANGGATAMDWSSL